MAGGTKKTVVGAHYGLGEWLAQRVTAVFLTFYSLALIVYAIAFRPAGYEGWAAIFVPLWMKVASVLAMFALLYHAWVGVRDIWMDYIKPTWLRLTLLILTVIWLGACAVWSVQILWRV
jgi:succinate dehydrogenase / fumarate reductase, membrane anchor subunit